MNTMTRSFILAGTLALAAAPAAAAPVQKVFFGEDLGLGENTPLTAFPNAQAAEVEFLSYLVGVGTETFEGFADNTYAPLALTFPGAGTATLTGGGDVNSVKPGTTNGFGRYAVSGSNYWAASSGSFAVAFTTPIAAFGFYGIDIGDFNGRLTLTTTGGATKNYTVNNTIGAPGGSVLFWGVIDTADSFTAIAFGNTNAGTDYFGFDNMTIGSVEQVVVRPESNVPMPAPLALIAAGLIGVGLSRPRRRA